MPRRLGDSYCRGARYQVKQFLWSGRLRLPTAEDPACDPPLSSTHRFRQRHRSGPTLIHPTAQWRLTQRAGLARLVYFLTSLCVALSYVLRIPCSGFTFRFS